jgi:hypothetical protein
MPSVIADCKVQSAERRFAAFAAFVPLWFNMFGLCGSHKIASAVARAF